MPDSYNTPRSSNPTSAAPQPDIDPAALAAGVKAACLQAALAAYEDAAANGLCAEGAWECAVDAMRRLKVEDLLQDASDQTSKR